MYTVNTSPCKRDIFTLFGVKGTLCGYATGYPHRICPWCKFPRATKDQRHARNRAKAAVQRAVQRAAQPYRDSMEG